MPGYPSGYARRRFRGNPPARITQIGSLLQPNLRRFVQSAMPNFHFQVIDDVFEHHDEEGIDLVDLHAAKVFGADMLRSIVESEKLDGIIDPTVHIRVESVRGDVLATIGRPASIKISEPA